jgi:hypothetical protein
MLIVEGHKRQAALLAASARAAFRMVIALADCAAKHQALIRVLQMLLLPATKQVYTLGGSTPWQI